MIADGGNTITIMPAQTDIRIKIVEAASKLISRYGYCKTTMADLAEACDMSPGNLYRYFPGKLEIAEQLVQQFFDTTLVRLRDVVRKPGLNATERLKMFLCTELHVTHSQLHDDPKSFEIAQIIKRQRPELANQNMARVKALMVEILAAGNASGEFNIPDVVSAAEMITNATWKYNYPQLFSSLSLADLEKELQGVVSLVLRGISCRGTAEIDALTAHRG